ncbi:MAG: tRNA lysidine(34) synthetase TilS [Synergistaceae bacterium]|nr:tRNA lysidine(34) synthetase TilS [Synergistaceae bacterium]
MTESRHTNIPFELSDYVLGRKFREIGEAQGWLDDSHAAVALSGGGDSVALLWMCSKFFSGKVTAIHVNHGIRGQESDEDEDFSRQLSQNLGADFLSVKVSVPNEQRTGESLETAARRLRIQALRNSAASLNIHTVLLAHNRDDLAETVLFNILRGTGIRGAVGITESSDYGGIRFCRPLLGMRREFLRDILRVRGISWREDSSNNDNSYTRNYIRSVLFPEISSRINASAVEHLAQFGSDMRPVRELEDEHSRELFASCIVSDSVLDWRKLRTLSLDDTALVIREAGRRLGLRTLSRRRCDELAGLMSGEKGFTFQWCGGVTVTGRKGRIEIHGHTGIDSTN